MIGVVAPVMADEPPTGDVVVVRCKLEYRDKSSIGSQVIGVMRDNLVRPGDRVKAGQVLGHLQDAELQAQVEVQQARAQSDLGLRVSEAKHAYLLGKLRTSEKLFARALLSSEDYGLQKLEAETARISIEDEKFKRGLAERELRLAQAMLRTREFTSPMDGIVVDVLKNPGEAVGYANDPVYRVVDPRLVRATGYIDVSDAWRVQVGHPVFVRVDIASVELPVERTKFAGQLVFVDRVVQAEAQITRVTAELENREDLLRDGLAGSMEIHLTAGPATTTPAAAPAPATAAAAAPTAEKGR